MNSQILVDQINSNIDSLILNLKNHQLEDGGFKGYHLFDKISGIWSTTEILHVLLKSNPDLISKDWINKSAKYILKNQNSDGGWGFRSNGKSIIDITAWACLALSHFKEKEAIIKGVDFILNARVNIVGEDKGGWGLTSFEPDRIYSSWIAANCLKRLLTNFENFFSESKKKEIYKAINESQSWIINAKLENGSWSPLGDECSTITSSAIALISIFSHGEDPRNYRSSFEYIKSEEINNLWLLDREVVITQEGYELTQEWFTSIYCFRAYIFFAELEICSIEKLHLTYLSLSSLLENGKVKPSLEASDDIIWTIPLLLEGIGKFKNFITTHKRAYDDYLHQKEIHEKKKKKREMEELLKSSFPYPISQVYAAFSQEIDYHRRFQFLIQLYEVIIKYTSIIALSTIIALNEEMPLLKVGIENKFRKPSLGDFVAIIEAIFSQSNKISLILSPQTKEELLKRQSNFIDNESPKVNLNQILSEIVSLRNSWTGHGAVRSVYEYKVEIESQLPLLFTLLHRFKFLAKCNSFLILSSDYNEFGDGDIYKIRVFNGLQIFDNDLEIQKRLSEGQRENLIRYVYFHNTDSNTIVNLYPFISHMFCSSCKKERFFFYNGVKNNNLIVYLSFECGHTIEYDNLEHFKKRFNAVKIQI
ncbi:terpene cyclase/mutase family protein [Mucilaginibacter sp.]|uniref:prenyltransferase/squalene oxidase repeat-containing protein n=1 Tax=Mucilaginibacter sp. TaxID=1882438 RepID=UPI0028511C4A|nr:terpene cyclase/mutase family protein [Mucilaginibacter sp.]MDR3696135.1 terpene cyclase/mutase family protein [Mucilaginibacter sp.]